MRLVNLTSLTIFAVLKFRIVRARTGHSFRAKRDAVIHGYDLMFLSQHVSLANAKMVTGYLTKVLSCFHERTEYTKKTG